MAYRVVCHRILQGVLCVPLTNSGATQLTACLNQRVANHSKIQDFCLDSIETVGLGSTVVVSLKTVFLNEAVIHDIKIDCGDLDTTLVEI